LQIAESLFGGKWNFVIKEIMKYRHRDDGILDLAENVPKIL